MGTHLSARTSRAVHGLAGVCGLGAGGLHSQHEPAFSAGREGSLGTQWCFSCRIAQFLWIPCVDACLVNGNGSETHLSGEMMGIEMASKMASSPNPLPQGSAPSPGLLTPSVASPVLLSCGWVDSFSQLMFSLQNTTDHPSSSHFSTCPSLLLLCFHSV